MKPLALLLFFSALAASQVPTVPVPTSAPAPPTTPASPVPSPSIVFGIGGGYNHYSNPASYESFVNIGVQIGTSNFWSVSTVSLQPKTASVRSGFGYAIKRSGPVLMILLADAGAVLSSAATANPAATVATPATTAFALGNVGGGVVLRYDLGDMTPALKGIGLTGGFRMAAITSQSVQPEVLFSISYFLK